MKPLALAIGVVFVAVTFFGLPALFVRLNDALGWPRLDSEAARAIGWGLVATGAIGLAATSRTFRERGGGTPVPVQPPERLVVDGIYRYTRNPIYLADLVVLGGIFLVRGHLALLLYPALFGAVIHLWLVRREEPALRARFGDAWEAYAARVPRWLGRPR